MTELRTVRELLGESGIALMAQPKRTQLEELAVWHDARLEGRKLPMPEGLEIWGPFSNGDHAIFGPFNISRLRSATIQWSPIVLKDGKKAKLVDYKHIAELIYWRSVVHCWDVYLSVEGWGRSRRHSGTLAHDAWKLGRNGVWSTNPWQRDANSSWMNTVTISAMVPNIAIKEGRRLGKLSWSINDVRIDNTRYIRRIETWQ